MPNALALAPVTTGLVIAYVRESNGDDLSPEGQLRDCRSLAVRYGYDPEAMVEVNDWGQSGRRIDRPGYQRIRSLIEDGRVSAVLARSVDRLGRDAQEVMAFEALAMTHGARILTDRDGERTVDPDSVNTLVRWLPALLAQEESRLGRDRARRGRITRQANIAEHREGCLDGPMCEDTGHWDGLPPSSPARRQLVASAYAETGSLQATTRRVNAIPGQRIDATSVARIMRWMAANGLVPPLPRGRRQGARPRNTHALSGLVRCPHDGSVLTVSNWFSTVGPRNARVNVPRVRLFCRVGTANGDHPRPFTTYQDVVLPAIQETLTNVLQRAETFHRFREGQPLILDAEGNIIGTDGSSDPVVAARLHSLNGDRDDLVASIERATRNGRSTAAYEAELRSVDADIERMTSEHDTVLLRTPIQWDDSSLSVNTRLRALIHHVVLDAALRPTGVVLRDRPEIAVDGDYEDIQPDPNAVPFMGAGWLLPLAPAQSAG